MSTDLVPARRAQRWLAPAVVAGSAAELGVIGWRFASGRLGPNPIASAMNQLGLLALILLFATLACTPLRIVYRVSWPLKIRRTLGLCAFGAAVLHFVVYLFLDQGAAIGRVLRDVVHRPFIAAGALALVLLCPLAWTSRRAAMRRMGHRQWQRLHRSVYVAATAGLVHYALRVKADFTGPMLYGAVLALLLGLRALAVLAERSRRRRALSSE